MNKCQLAFIILLSVFTAGTACADYNSADLQKLFTDKNQRAQIDAVRSGHNKKSDVKQATEIKVSGYVTRSDGKSVVWVNNENTLDSSKIGGVKVYPSSVGNNKKVTVSVDGKTKRLKPGEIWHKETGNIVDGQ